MEQKPRQTKTPGSDRDARLKAALKANLARRKAQAKARSAPQPEAGAQTDPKAAQAAQPKE